MTTMFLDALPSTVAGENTIALPIRKLDSPDFDHLGFDCYKTSHFYLDCHITSSDAQPENRWPERCLSIGYEEYYSESYDESSWRSVESSSIIPLRNLSLHPATCVLHYGPSVFEGTKAFVSHKNRIVLFRPEANGARLIKSAARLLLPKFPVKRFVPAVAATAIANRKFIPPYQAEHWHWKTRNPRCLYLRPILIGHGPQLGVRPAMDHIFFIYSSPVRAYYPVEGVRVLITTAFHRAAPGGTGSAKSASNYVPGLLPTQLARRGFDWLEGKPIKVSETPFHDVLYLDPAENRFIEEFSGANFMAVSTAGTLVCPDSETILPGVTRESVLTLAADMGMTIEKRRLSVDELMDEKRIAEAFCTGNAAVITPIVHIRHRDQVRTFDIEKAVVAKRLWDVLVGIQLQTRDDPYGWVKEIA